MSLDRRGLLKMLGLAPVVAAPVAAAAAAKSLPEQSAGFDFMPRNPLHIPENVVPKGMTYGWKRVFITGEPEMENLAYMVAQGWKAVPMSRHADHFKGKSANHWVEVGGLVLMEKPTSNIAPPEPPYDPISRFNRRAELKQEGSPMPKEIFRW